MRRQMVVMGMRHQSPPLGFFGIHPKIHLREIDPTRLGLHLPIHPSFYLLPHPDLYLTPSPL